MQATHFVLCFPYNVMKAIRPTIVVLGLTACAASLAQTAGLAPASTANTSKSAPAIPSPVGAAIVSAPSTPRWIDLTLSQQDSLMPLADTWNTLGLGQKRKWIALAQNYPSLAAPEQAKLHSRMAEWAALSPSKREQARFNFSTTKKISDPDRASKWEAYKALSPQERENLANRAPSKPTGAATAIKPVPAEKFTPIPVTRRTPAQLRELTFSKQSIDRNTLLPLPPQPGSEPLPSKN